MDFFKKAFLEIKHVVWPTKKESLVYMNYNIVIMVVMTIFLSLVGFLFKEGLTQAKYLVNPDSRNAVQNFYAQQAEVQANAEADVYEQFGLTPDNQTEPTVTNENLEVTTETPTAEENTETPTPQTEENTTGTGA